MPVDEGVVGGLAYFIVSPAKIKTVILYRQIVPGLGNDRSLRVSTLLFAEGRSIRRSTDCDDIE